MEQALHGVSIDLLAFELLALALLLYHLFHKRNEGFWMALIGSAVTAMALLYFVFFATLPSVTLKDLLGITFLYASSLLVSISELLARGLGERLTAWRGDKWIKELDYFYLAFGAIGVVISINRLGSVENKLNISDVYGPLILATALVIRAVKTRAEINGWNKLKS